MTHRILIIDDNPQIHEDFKKVLGVQDAGGQSIDSDAAKLFGPAGAAETLPNPFELDFACQGRDGLRMVEAAAREDRPYALAFVDVRMPPGWDGIETVKHIWQAYPELQVVICTAYADYSWHSIIQELGKSEGLVILKKPFEYIEVLQLAHALTEKWRLNRDVQINLQQLDELVEQRTRELTSANERLQKEIEEREKIGKFLADSEDRFSKAFQASPNPLVLVALGDRRYMDVNQAFEKATGYGRQEVLGRSFFDIPLWNDKTTSSRLMELLKGGDSVRGLECALRTKAQGEIKALVSSESTNYNQCECLLLIIEMFGGPANVEDGGQSNKMELVGRMTAGIAHDFNNIITIIQCYADLALARNQTEQNVRNAMNHVSLATKKATALTSQLLTFSRSRDPQHKRIDLNELIGNLKDMIDRLLHEDVELRIESRAPSAAVQGDEGMLDQVLLNLAANARDAMHGGGVLTIAVSLHESDSLQSEAVASHPSGGPYACVEVGDTGCGMDPETAKKIFDPFFTTKQTGKGTGLGLATVNDIVKKHQGWIEVSSEPNKGTVFRIFLPAV